MARCLWGCYEEGDDGSPGDSTGGSPFGAKWAYQTAPLILPRANRRVSLILSGSAMDSGRAFMELQKLNEMRQLEFVFVHKEPALVVPQKIVVILMAETQLAKWFSCDVSEIDKHEMNLNV